MAISKAIPKRGKLSTGDLFLSFGAIAFPIHVWAIIDILYVIPAWMLRYTKWELAGAIGYPLVDALLESVLLWSGFVLLGYLLPRKWLADKFVALSSALAWVLAAWAILVQYIYKSILTWGGIQLLLGLLVVALSFGLVYWLVQRYGQMEKGVNQLTQRLVVLTYIYVVTDLVGLVVVVLRNL